jgi:hypothetical protein
MAINPRRVWQGALLGGVVFFLWSLITAFVIAPGLVGSHRLAAASRAGFLLERGRIPLWLFLLVWFAGLWVVSYGAAWAYAGVRATYGAGLLTAAKLGLLVGFAAGFPLNFAHAVFQGLAPLFWMVWVIEMGVGGLLATLAAAWMYRD